MQEHDLQRTIDLLRRRIEALEERVFGGSGWEASGFASDRAGPRKLEDAVVSELQRKGKIHAIQLYRERTGAGLREAKEAVQRIEQLYLPR